MKLHFKNGAIVRFGLSCEANLSACGKVVKVTEDEVVFIPQEYVAENDYYDERWGSTQLDRKVSVDGNTEKHLDRSFIVMWEYASVPYSDRTTYHGVYRRSEITNLVVNRYDEDGFCKGQGEFFE